MIAFCDLLVAVRKIGMKSYKEPFRVHIVVRLLSFGDECGQMEGVKQLFNDREYVVLSRIT
jgi:hypothetical protein